MNPQPSKQTEKSFLVSVIMNCFNSDRYLLEAIDSVYAQTYDNWEIIFLDNASTDRSAAIAKSYDNKLQYFRNKKTVPLGQARNQALEKAKGELIAFLDCDDIWEPEKLQKTVPLFSKDPDLGLVFSNGMIIDSKGNFLGPEIVKSREKKLNEKDSNVFYRLLADNFIGCPVAVVLRTDFTREVGFFDETLTMAEEIDLYLKIAAEYPIKYVPEMLYRYRVHPYSPSIHKQDILTEESMKIFQYWTLRKPELLTTHRYYYEIQLFKRFSRKAFHCLRMGKTRELLKALHSLFFERNIKTRSFLKIIRNYYSIDYLIRIAKRWKERMIG
jgi:glycosyltransferase involved in cell wall biosynthesis